MRKKLLYLEKQARRAVRYTWPILYCSQVLQIFHPLLQQEHLEVDILVIKKDDTLKKLLLKKKKSQAHKKPSCSCLVWASHQNSRPLSPLLWSEVWMKQHQAQRCCVCALPFPCWSQWAAPRGTPGAITSAFQAVPRGAKLPSETVWRSPDVTLP